MTDQRLLKKITKKILAHSDPIDFRDSEWKHFDKYMASIRRFTAEFKRGLDQLSSHAYINVYQAAGNSVRRTGTIHPNYQNEEFNPSCVYHLPETINRVIKVIRRQGDGKAHIVIDAIRNPYEVRYFKDRYSSFYLMAINTSNEDRKKYLQNVHKYSVDEFDRIEDRESGKTKVDDKDFISQNVKNCVEMADIHLVNPRNEIDNNNLLKAQLAWYLALIKQPGIITPTNSERVMQVAYAAKLNSGCISRQVGAAVTDSNYSVKAIGWNEVAKGQVPCNLRCLHGLKSEFDSTTYSKYEMTDSKFREKAESELSGYEVIAKDLKGKNLSYCFKDIKTSLDSSKNQVHTRSLHAEENAFLQLVKYGSSGIEGGKLYTTASPCELCAKKAYQLGITEIIYIDPYPGISLDHILEVGSQRPQLIQFRGAVGRAYHQLYEPIMSYKDELNYLKS